MNEPTEILILNSSPIFAAALQGWLAGDPDGVRCCLLDAGGMASPFPVPDGAVIVLVPREWHELAAWLPALQARFPKQPWLVLADLRLAGMFLSVLDRPRCTLVPPEASTERLQLSLKVLAVGQALLPPAELIARLSRGLGMTVEEKPVVLTAREVECGCAAALGLSNHQIAEALHLGVGTVKNHLHTLMQKLPVAHREEMFTWLERALRPALALPAPAPVTPARGKAGRRAAKSPRRTGPSPPGV